MLKSFLVKVLAKIIQIIGLIYRPRKRIIGIKTILVNKADRIGDAIVALPFLLELKKYFQLTILTTKSNDFVFRDFFITNIILEKPRYIYDELKAILKTFLLLFQKTDKNVPQYDLYLDLNGIREIDLLLEMKKENKCKYYAGLNSGPFNIFLDYAYKNNSMLFAKHHILETFMEIAHECFQLDIEVPDFIDLSSKMKQPEGLELNSLFVLVNISRSNNFKGPLVEFYAEIVKDLSLSKDINFFIMDDPGQPNMRTFRNLIGDDKRVSYLNMDLSLWELLFIASKSMLYIGSDSGATNFLNLYTNAIIFYGSGLPIPFKPYSKNPYIKKEKNGLIVEETRTSKGFIKKVIYKPLWCRPCFEIGCRFKHCVQFDMQLIREEIAGVLSDVLHTSK